MDKSIHRNRNFHGAQWLVGLLATAILIPALHAQPTEETVQGRVLFVFDTSRAMKPRIEQVQKTLNTILATSLSGQMHSGDSIGVWTFNQNLRPGDYPLQTWNPDQAALLASNLVKFVEKQHYAKSTRFEALQPLLGRVVQNSARLTVLIFCDGGSKLSGTPYDAGVNQIFSERYNEQKKTGQPFVIVLRSQLGQYAGCTLTLPPEPMTYPPFPPLPKPPPPAPQVTNAPTPPPAPAPVVVPTAPLIIIGTKSSVEPAPLTNEPPPATPPAGQIHSNAPPPQATVPVKTNLPEQSTAPAKNVDAGAAAAPAAPASAPQKAGNPGIFFLLLAAGLLGAAIALVIVFWLRPRRKDVSLITRSLNDRDRD